MLTEVLIGLGIIIILFLLFWRFWFLRDPVRSIPEGENIVSPADGKIIKIVNIKSDKIEIDKGIFGKIKTISKDVKNAQYLISIFMSPLDVHVQRAPINGSIVNVKYQKGKFLAANTLEALQNENNEILIEEYDTVKVIQIAGFIARRIECFVKKGEKILKGHKIGRINLGSQVSIILPKNVNIKVKEGQKVKAGSTIIADLI